MSRRTLFTLAISLTFATPALAQSTRPKADGKIELLPSQVKDSGVSFLLVGEDSQALDTSANLSIAGEALMSDEELTADSASETALDTDFDSDTDTVREKIAGGYIERHVALDSQGNYVNHGPFKQMDAHGSVVLSGQYKQGTRVGNWTKMVSDRRLALLNAYPYNKAKLPLKSSVNFVDGKMQGVWTIEDADHRLLSQIELKQGLRSGSSDWLHPNGSILYHCEYKEGKLHGLFVELDAKGKAVRELNFTNGVRVSKESEYFANKKLKAEYSIAIQTPPPKLDDFDSLTLAVPSEPAESLKDGPFTTYHPNGKVRVQGSYRNGKLDGSFESWYANGLIECIGNYKLGEQEGKWSWWFENGMRKAITSYEEGQAVGELLAWDEEGQRRDAKSLLR